MKDDTPKCSAPRKPLDQDPQKVRRRRYEAGLTQKALAEKSGVSSTYLCGIERGARNASPVALSRLADALGCKVADLMPDLPVKAAV